MFKRRIRHRFASMTYYRKPISRGSKYLSILIFLILLLFISAIIVAFKTHPLLVQLATAVAGDEVIVIVNDTVNEKMAKGNMDYDDLITLEKDASGNVTALITNTAQINTLRAEITNSIIEKLAQSETTLVNIPLGNLFGTAILSGRGPDIPIKVIALTAVSTDFLNDFSSAGINQTRHIIILNVNLVLEVLLPGGIETIPMNMDIGIAETVIVGKVPETYADFYTLGEHP